MSARRRNRQAAKTAGKDAAKTGAAARRRGTMPSSAASGAGTSWWLLSGLAALVTAQVLLPADAATVVDGASLPLAMLWLVLTAVWLLVAVGARGITIRWSASDVALLILLGLHSTAAVLAARQGAPRPALNVLWQWIAMGAAFFLIRQMVRSPDEQRALCGVTMALAVGLAAYAYYQVAIDIPASRRWYEHDPERALHEALGLESSAKVSPLARQQFKARLYSPEPYATFSLANSLAGYVAPWLVVLVGVVWFGLGVPPPGKGARIGGIVCAAAVAVVLLLTRSRSGYLAVLVGLSGVVGLGLAGGRRFGRKAAAVSLAGVVVIAALAAGALTLDHPLSDAARQSARYRTEYWQATWRMITDQAWLGCGPGQFADTYTAYKLPEAFEEIADPHNFLFEVWATAGTPAAIALVAMLGCFFVRVLVGRSADQKLDNANDAMHEAVMPSAASSAHVYVMAGGMAGIPLALFLASVYAGLMNSVLDLAAVIIIAVPATATLVLLRPWIASGRLPPALIAMGVISLLVHLSASGGIGNPGVAISLWLLMALGLNRTELNQKEHATGGAAWGRGMVIILLAFVLCLTGLCQLTAYGPVVRSRTAAEAARRLAGHGDSQAAARKWREAAVADPLATEPIRLLAIGIHQSLIRPAAEADAAQRQVSRAEFENLKATWLANAPRSSTFRRETGEMYLHRYRATGRIEDIEAAAAAYREAIQRYPNSAVLHAHLAWSYHLAGQAERARQAAARALELDARNPHSDKQLASPNQRLNDREAGSQNTRELMQRLVAP